MKTYYQANLNLDLDLGRTNYTPPTTLYLGLSTTPISRDGSGATEPSTNAGYTRVAITNDKTKWSASSNGELFNISAIEFPESTNTWGTVTHYFFSDSQTGGNIRFYEAFSTPRQIQANSTVMFKPQTLKFSDQ